jgi:hypothetical protein
MAPTSRGHKTWCGSLSSLSIGGQRDGVKLLEGEIISVFSPQNSSSTETGVWTRRESNPHLHFDREPCYRCTTGPEPSFFDGAEDGKSAISNFFARVPNWDESLAGWPSLYFG